MINLNSNRQMMRASWSRARSRGLSLIELMVALVISLVLIGGAIQVYVFSRQNYDVNESVARLQESARYALSVLEPDIRMANQWGLLKGFIEVPAAGFDTNCGTNFAGNLTATLGGTDNQYSFGCAAYGNGAVGSSDTLIVRRASVIPSTATSGRLLVCSTRTQAVLVTDSTTCIAPPNGQVNDLIVNAYYVDRDSEFRAGVPTLRRWVLTGVNAMTDVEIVPGVEDMQIQFGIDTTGTAGIAQRYVSPGNVPPNAQIVTVRLWLLVRSETPEQDLDTSTRQVYEYGDRDIDNGETSDLSATGAARQAYVPQDRFRRLLVSKTIQVRNALGT